MPISGARNQEPGSNASCSQQTDSGYEANFTSQQAHALYLKAAGLLLSYRATVCAVLYYSSYSNFEDRPLLGSHQQHPDS